MSIEKITSIGGFAKFQKDKLSFTVTCNISVNLIPKEDYALRGFYLSLLMLPESWVIHKSKLCEEFRIGKNKLNQYFTKLKRLGLLTVSQSRDESGHYTCTDYKIHLLPVQESDGEHESRVPRKPGAPETVTTDMDPYKVKEINKEKENKESEVVSTKSTQTQLSKDFTITEKHRQYCREKGYLGPENFIDDFVHYFTVEKRTKRVDWDRAFMNWIKKDFSNSFKQMKKETTPGVESFYPGAIME